MATTLAFVPANSDADTGNVNHAVSFDPSTVEEASVVELTVPPGMFDRATSVPFTYTTAPSSRRTRSVIEVKAFVAVNAWRK